MDAFKQNQIREALQQLATAHAATIQQMERAMALLAEALEIDGDVEQYSPTKESSLAGLVRIHRSLLSVEYQGKHYFLGNTLLFRLIERLANKPNKSNQEEVIREYAATHGYELVKTYADGGKRVRNVAGRECLRQMINDVQNGKHFWTINYEVGVGEASRMPLRARDDR